MNEIELKLCKCGCRKPVNEGSEFLPGHYSKWKKNRPKEEKQEEAIKEPDQPSAPLTITNVQPSNIDPESDDVAWFIDEKGERTSKIPLFIGMHDNIPCCLVVSVYGQFIPVYLMPGFIGMFPAYYTFPEPVQVQNESQGERPVESIKTVNEPIITPFEEAQNEKVIIHAQEPKKKSFLAGIFGKKEKKEKTEGNPEEIKDMLREVANSTGRTT